MYFITGANGLVGCYIVVELLKHSDSIINCSVRTERAKLQLIHDVIKISKCAESELENRLKFSFGDIMDSNYLEENMNAETRVIHAAACVSFDDRDRELLFDTNITGTENVVNAGLTKKIKKLCFISSVAAIGRSQINSSISEQTEWENSMRNTNYAISKYYAELEVWRGSEEGLQMAIVNPTVVLGYTSQGNSSSSIFYNIKKGFPFSSKGINGFVGAADVARTVNLLLHSDIKNERFVLCSENMSFNNLFGKIAAELGKRPPFITVRPWMKWITLPVAWLISLFTNKAPFVTKEIFETSMGMNYYSAEKLKNTLHFKFTPVAQIVKEVAHLMS